MKRNKLIKPDFLVIGAQKAGTGWLWHMLKQHPETSLPTKKEIHFFGSAEIFKKGTDWYYSHFADLDEKKVVGEASTTYFYDRVPFWHNSSNQIEFDESLPALPEIIARELPDIKIVVSLRDPVSRAVSAYHHWMRMGKLSPRLGLKKIAIDFPKLRILEYGYYDKYLDVWQKYVPAERMHIIIFEEDIVGNYQKGLSSLYDFLSLSPDFAPETAQKIVHKSWSWPRIVFNYYAKGFSNRLASSKISPLIGRYFPFRRNGATKEDIGFLRDHYLPTKYKLERILGRKLNSWTLGGR